MSILRLFARRTALLVAVLLVWTHPASAQGDPTPSLSAAQRRARLTNPAHPFWKTQAPDTATFDVETSRGTFTLQLVHEWAPSGVDRFYNLARAGFFDDTRFYRVLPFHVAQFGLASSPAIDAIWRDRKIRRDSVRESNVRGALTFAQNTPRDRSSTLFLNLRDNPTLDSLGFTPIGRVIEGMEVVDSVYSGYGELPSSPAPMGNTRRFYGESNRYLDKAYPKLDRIVAIRVRPYPFLRIHERDRTARDRAHGLLPPLTFTLARRPDARECAGASLSVHSTPCRCLMTRTETHRPMIRLCDRCGREHVAGLNAAAAREDDAFLPVLRVSLCPACLAMTREEQRPIPTADEAARAEDFLLDELRPNAESVVREGNPERLRELALFLEDLSKDLSRPLPDDLRAVVERYRPRAD